jgi:hypothetical protein
MDRLPDADSDGMPQNVVILQSFWASNLPKRCTVEVVALLHRTMNEQYAQLRLRLNDIAEGCSTCVDPEQIAHFAWTYRRHMTFGSGGRPTLCRGSPG